MRVQGRSRSELPYRSRVQPYAAWYALVGCVLMLLINGYTGEHPPLFDPSALLMHNFLSLSILERLLVNIDFYFLIFVRKNRPLQPFQLSLPHPHLLGVSMIPFFLVIAVGWKVLRRNPVQRLATMDLVGETPIIDAYEHQLVELENEATRKRRENAILEERMHEGPGWAILRPVQVAWARLALWFG